MVAGLATLFELYWDRAVPLATYVGQPVVDRPTPEERDLLALLMSGFTDLEMAAHLGLSERTVRTRIVGMRHRLSADTRLQAWTAATSQSPRTSRWRCCCSTKSGCCGTRVHGWINWPRSTGTTPR
ncbi:helix-turn-helix transcriptional regulator [Kribbella sp. NPDC050820]|uniref:helix-turn-helix domain-containing protein n=1 Tax=Kribbella sp. NPDC050820 TaxID=3155408 RepID=UPI0033FD306E